MVQLRAELPDPARRGRGLPAPDRGGDRGGRGTIERDLHDGAQQRLVSIGLTVRHLQHDSAMLAGGDSIHRGGGARGHRDDRGVARDRPSIRPGVLDDGLGSALRDLAQRTELPLVVAVPERRFPKELETAAYFIACEGVTNAVKHAGATRLDLVVCEVPGGLVVRVSDDGAGGARCAGSNT